MFLPTKENCFLCSNFSEFYCYGCQRSFCSSHTDEHRKLLDEQLDWFTVDHDDFLAELNRTTAIPSENDPYRSIIDRWERESLVEIEKIANQARSALIDARNLHIHETKAKLSVLTKKLHRAYEQENIFDEQILTQWTEKLRHLRQEFVYSPNFSVRIYGNRPVVMPIIKIQQKKENSASDRSKTTIGLVPLENTNEFTACLRQTPWKDKLSFCISSNSEFNVIEDRFHICTDHVRICDQGELIIHDGTRNEASVRGLLEYSRGEQKLYFLIESSTSDSWIFFGITSKCAVFDQRAFANTSTYGWAADQSLYINGKHHIHSQKGFFSFKEKDLLEFTIDCQRRTLSIRKLPDGKEQKLIVDLQNSPFPWQCLVSLKNPNDSIRILPEPISLIQTKEKI